jgi:hypothetical protein
MTDVLKLSDGTTDCDLMFSSAPGFQLLAGGLKFATPEHENLYHSSEWQDGEELARHKLENRVWPMKLALKSSSSDDNIANELIKLNRLIRQARRYQLAGDVSKVYLHIKLDGATNWTRFDLIDAVLESADIFSYFNRKSGDVKFDGAIGLELTTTSFGYGEEVALANELGTPHFEEDGDSDGLADQWNESAGTETTSLDTTIYLLGSQSQEVITNTTSSHGIYSDTVTVSGVDNIASYAWLFCTSGSDEVTLDVQADSTGSIGTATYSAATETDTGANSNTWKRLDVIGSTTASDTTLTMRVERLSGGASKATTFYIDKTYLQLDATSVPDGWASCRRIYQHSDSDEGTVVYIDVVGIHGDLPAPIKIETPSVSLDAGFGTTWIAIRNDTEANIATTDYFQDLTGNADNARIGNTYATITPDTTAADLSSTTISNLNKHTRRFRVLASLYDIEAYDGGGTLAEFRVGRRYTGEGVALATYNDYKQITSELTPPLTTPYRWVDLGIIDYRIEGANADDVSQSLSGIVNIQAKRTSGSSAVRADAFMLFPVESMFMFDGDDKVGAVTLSALDEQDIAYYSPSVLNRYEVLSSLGTIPRLEPDKVNRLFMLFGGDIGNPSSGQQPASNPADTVDTKITYRPRTEFLLGTD